MDTLLASHRRRNFRSRTVAAAVGLSLLVAGLPHRRVAAEPVAGAFHQWDASLDDGQDSVWEDTGAAANQHWSLSGFGGPNPAGPPRVAVSSAHNLTHAYRFDGIYDRGRAAAENRVGEHNASFELWFRPDGLPEGTARTIFENGNEPRGLTIGLAGDLLVFAYAAGHSTYADLTYDLDVDDNGIDNPDFIQIVAVVDDANDQLRLYVDGENEQILAVGATSDYTSNNDWGLGKNNDNGGAQGESPYTWGASFAGEIALLREYRFAFTQVEVAQNYAAVAALPASADFDADGQVSGSDLLIWQRGFGSDGGFSGGDADGSGLVDGLDLVTWQAQYGTLGGGAGQAVTSVPSPGGGTIATLAVASVWAAVRRRRGAAIELSARCANCRASHANYRQ